jgi:hypothetical protein
MTNTEWVIAGATLAGPILAVQAQKWVELGRERRAIKVRVFTVLMATRAARLSSEHVQALNMIAIAFYGVRTVFGPYRSKRDQNVLDAWNEYHDNLGATVGVDKAEEQRIYAQRDETFLNLLHTMAIALNFGFDRVQLKKGGYTPVAHGAVEEDQLQIRKLAIEVLSGKSALTVRPVPPVAGANPQTPPQQD